MRQLYRFRKTSGHSWLFLAKFGRFWPLRNKFRTNLKGFPQNVWWSEKQCLSLHRVFHSIRFKVNNGIQRGPIFLPGQFGLTSMEKAEITPDYNFRSFRTGGTIPPVQEYNSSIKSDFTNLSISNYSQMRIDAFSNTILMVH